MELHELHELQLAAIDEVDRLCAEHKIEYFVLYGTLLGAVRHGGFIPWDDDVDLGMMRCDYDRFLAAAEAGLDSRYFIQTHRTDMGYPLSFAKVRVNGTVFRERGFAEAAFHEGVYVDIFPLDRTPKSRWARAVHGLVLRLLKTAALSRSDYLRLPGLARHVVYSILGVLARPFGLGAIMGLQERVSGVFNGRCSDWLVSNGGPYGYARETVAASLFAERKRFPFEGRLLPGPLGWDDYLRHMYGD